MRACLTFYKTLAFPLIGISVICGQQVWAAHSAYFVFRVLWVKVLTSLVIATYTWTFRSGQFVFYNNLGYSQARLLLLSFGLDFAIWLLIILGVVIVL